ncbi:hypothetical protein SAMN05444157_2539 [Frankineae bacterium MT45]|nr:hypothetical protein SAMN05444157_2539 [Frankineae bacterium MT45]
MSRRHFSAAAAAALSAALAFSLAGCGTSQITGHGLEAAVGPTFARLYVLDQQALGNRGSDKTPDGYAQCTRGVIASNVAPAPRSGSSASSYSGAGDDWSCVVNFPYPDGHIEPIVYDLSVEATGCYVATGPSSVVGPQTFKAASGRTVTNPLFEFDGCLNLH